MNTQQRRRSPVSSTVVALCTLLMGSAEGFVPSVNHMPYKAFVATRTSAKVLDVPARKTNTQLNNFMGSDGGILGIGGPELFTILLVGYFVLGPSDLYKLTKEIGKFVQNFRTFADEATATLENSMEGQLQMDEIRKTQRELNDAFNFRRSINVEADSSPFEVNAKSPRLDTTPPTVTEEEEADDKPKKKIRRRRVKKKMVEEEAEEEPFCVGDTNEGAVANNVPDLDIDEEMLDSEERMMQSLAEAKEELGKEQLEVEAAELRKQRLERLQGGTSSDESRLAEQELSSTDGYDSSFLSEADTRSRFEAQMSGNWNEQILGKEDELGPIANIMERLAILEEEKNAADARLRGEFKVREENEEQFYREKRQLLEEAAAKVQAEAYSTTGPSTENTNTQS